MTKIVATRTTAPRRSTLFDTDRKEGDRYDE